MIRIVLFSITLGFAAILLAYWGILESTSLRAAEASEASTLAVTATTEEAPREALTRRVIEASAAGGAASAVRHLRGLGPKE